MTVRTQHTVQVQNTFHDYVSNLVYI